MNHEPPSILSLLDRPASERLRENKYRLAQCLIFGLPVIALQFFGPMLGGAEADRWIGLLQSLLAGWVMYIGAVPMLVEGLLFLGKWKIKLELIVALLALTLYGVGLAGWIIILRGWWAPFPYAFSCAIVLLIVWSGVQWARLARHSG